MSLQSKDAISDNKEQSSASIPPSDPEGPEISTLPAGLTTTGTQHVSKVKVPDSSHILECQESEKEPLNVETKGAQKPAASDDCKNNNNVADNVASADKHAIATTSASDAAYGTGEVNCIKGCIDARHWQSWFLTIGLWSLIILKIHCEVNFSRYCHCDDYGFFFDDSCEDNIDYDCDSPCDFCITYSYWWWIVFVVGILLYCFEVYICSTRKYLSNVVEDIVVLFEILNSLKQEKPNIFMYVENYHFETRTRTVYYTDANGNSQSRIETYQERIVTSSYYQEYKFRTWEDRSQSFDGLTEYQVTKLEVTKNFTFANPETRQNWDFLADEFKKNHRYDVFQLFWTTLTINGYKEKYLCELEKGMKPKWIDLRVFYLCSIFLLSAVYRTMMSACVGKKQYSLVKEVSI